MNLLLCALKIQTKKKNAPVTLFWLFCDYQIYSSMVLTVGSLGSTFIIDVYSVSVSSNVNIQNLYPSAYLRSVIYKLPLHCLML